MTSATILLKDLLRERHWQTYRTFCAEYDKQARKIDPSLVGTWPSRAQLHRWLSGNLKGLPYPDHCRILEAMFPGHTAHDLFTTTAARGPTSHASENAKVFSAVADGLAAPETQTADWEMAARLTNTTSDRDAVDLPSRMTEGSDGLNSLARGLGQKLLELQTILRLSSDEVRLLAGLSGNVVELSMAMDLDISKDGKAHIAYRHEILNLTSKPITRLPRELWFVYTDGPLIIEPIAEGKRRIAIQRVHDTPTLSKCN